MWAAGLDPCNISCLARSGQCKDTEAVSILSLSRDALCEQVLGYCHRDVVKQVIMVPLLCKHFELSQGFCESHGTKLDASTEQQPRCIDCRMLQQGHARCEKCVDFSHMIALRSAACGKTVCYNCGVSCDDCGEIYDANCSECRIMYHCNCCQRTSCDVCLGIC